MSISYVVSVALIANGEMPHPETMAPFVRQSEKVIAVDGGLKYCDKMEITPDFMIGDFDSADPKLLEKYKDIPKSTYPRDKDFTDLELAIVKAQEFNPQKIILYAVLGKRTDHSLYNLNLLGRMPGKLWIETESETLYAIRDHVVIDCYPGQTVSLIPLASSAKGVTTKGLKWEMTDADLSQDFMSISNIALKDKVTVTVKQGLLLCIKEKMND